MKKLSLLNVLTKNSKRIIAEDMLGLGKYQKGSTRTSKPGKNYPQRMGA